MKKYLISLIVMIILLAATLAILLFNGIIWFVNPQSSGYHVKGIDVARYQREIDWQLISSQEIKFAFVKATEGSSYSDPFFAVNITSSRENGIYAGAYHFFSSESSGKTQAENFIKTVSEYNIDLPPVLDFEISNTQRGEKENIISEAHIFLREIEAYFAVKPIIYTTSESYKAFLTDGFDEYPLWFRDLLKEPDIKGNQDWLFWQYCNRGHINGIDGEYVDLNVFNGTASEFEAYISAS